MYYTLTDTRVVVPTDAYGAEVILQDFKRKQVALTKLSEMAVSTVFLSVDHNMGHSERPVVFETMVFVEGTFHNVDLGEDAPDTFRRYSTWGEAEAGHAAIVAGLKAWQASRQEAPNMSKKHKHDEKADEAKRTEKETAKETEEASKRTADDDSEPVSNTHAEGNHPQVTLPPAEDPPEGTPSKAPQGLTVTSKNLDDLRVTTLASRLACGLSDAFGTVVRLYLGVADGTIPKLDESHLWTWSTHEGFSDLRKRALWSGLKTSGWLKGSPKDGWKLDQFDATQHVELLKE